MKKRLLGVVFLICILAGCQENPDEEFVTGKNDGVFESLVQETSALEEYEEISEEREYQYSTVQETFLGAEDAVSIEVNADVAYQTGSMPVIRVAPHEITSEEVKLWSQVLFEGATAYEPQIMLSREELSQRILDLKQKLSDEDGMLEYYDGNTAEVEAVRADYEAELAFYEQKYEDAPEVVEKKETDWIFHESQYYDYMAELDAEIWGQEEVANLNATQQLIVNAEVGGFTATITASNRNADDFMYHNMNFSVSDAYQTTPLQQSEEDAVLMAENALEKLGLSEKWKFLSIKPIQRTIGGEIEYYYSLMFQPNYEGVDVTRQTQLSTVKGEEGYAALYFYEELSMQISNNRIVDIWWNSPLDIIAVENPNVKILNIDEAMGNFKKQMQIEATMYNLVGDRENEYEKAVARIDSIELGLVRIKVPDNAREFYLVPAWTFRGETGRDSGNGVKYYSEDPIFQDSNGMGAESFSVTYQTINAVDGSFINVYLGY